MIKDPTTRFFLRALTVLSGATFMMIATEPKHIRTGWVVYIIAGLVATDCKPWTK